MYIISNNYFLKDQRTALHMASKKGHIEIVQLLLQSSAHLNICDKVSNHF